jgi:hypothetical protein
VDGTTVAHNLPPPPSPNAPHAPDDDDGPDAIVVDPVEHAPPPCTAPTVQLRARGTRRGQDVPGEQVRTLIYAPEPTRAAWIESELSRAPITVTIQVGRRVRTIVSALVKDPPPRPQVLIVDFDAIAPGELLDLHVIRDEGWSGRLIALGTVPPELRASLAIDDVLTPPFLRDSLLDCVAGTRPAPEPVPMPTFWMAAFSRDRSG